MLSNILSRHLLKKFMQPGILVVVAVYQPVSFAELATLFTTPQERQIINANRYKTDEVKKAPEIILPENSGIRELVREEVSKSYFVSGITVSNDGVSTVWINNQVYEDGERIDDASRITVLDGDNIRVRITTPDGKHYYGSSGETVEVSYLETAGH